MSLREAEGGRRQSGEGWRRIFQIADCILAVEGDDPRLEVLADSLYQAAQPATGVPRERFRLGRCGTRFRLQRGDGPGVVVAGLPALFQEAEWTLTEAAMQGADAFFQVHAGVVAWGDRAALLAGPPDSGKTSLVLGLAQVGAVVFTDEVALIRPHSLRVTPFPRDLIVHRGTQQLFAEWVARVETPPWKVGDGYRYLSMRELGMPVPTGTAVIEGLFFPVLQPGAALTCRPLGPAEAARRLLGQAFNLSSWGGLGIDLIGRLVETCPAIELCFGDARSAAGWICDRM